MSTFALENNQEKMEKSENRMTYWIDIADYDLT